MSGILISVQKAYSSKVFGIPEPGRPPSSIRYSLYTILSRVPNFFLILLFFREGGRRAQTRVVYSDPIIFSTLQNTAEVIFLNAVEYRLRFLLDARHCFMYVCI
jgi:hypothetical protein